MRLILFLQYLAKVNHERSRFKCQNSSNYTASYFLLAWLNAGLVRRRIKLNVLKIKDIHLNPKLIMIAKRRVIEKTVTLDIISFYFSNYLPA